MSDGKEYFRPWSNTDEIKVEKNSTSDKIIDGSVVFYLQDDDELSSTSEALSPTKRQCESTYSSDSGEEFPESNRRSLARLSSMVDAGNKFSDHDQAAIDRSTVGSSPSSSCASNGESPYSAFTPTSFRWSSIDRLRAEYLEQAQTYQAQLNYYGLPTGNIGHYSGMDEALKLIQQDAAAKRMKKLRPKKFKCSECPMTFSNNGQLRGHFRIHTGK